MIQEKTTSAQIFIKFNCWSYNCPGEKTLMDILLFSVQKNKKSVHIYIYLFKKIYQKQTNALKNHISLSKLQLYLN